MIDLTFDRPIGAAADARELEYITALHQTSDEDDESFQDGSIDAKDIMYYLTSRYGINVPLQEIRKTIMNDFGGGDNEDECIDICEIVALLLIPFFVKSVKGDVDFGDIESNKSIRMRGFDSDNQFKSYMKDIEYCKSLVEKDAVIRHVFNIILEESLGTTDPQPMTAELVRKIFKRFGENDLAQNDVLIDEMIQDVTGGNPEVLFSADSFTRALSHDVMLYNVDHECRLSTFYDDVFGMDGDDDENENNGTDKRRTNGTHETAMLNTNKDVDEVTIQEEERSSPNSSSNGIFSRTVTCAQVDFMSDSCASKAHMIYAYIAYIYFIFVHIQRDAKIEICEEHMIGCNIAERLLFFVAVMAFNICLGVPWLLLLTSGNIIKGKTLTNLVLLVAGVQIFAFLSRTIRFDFFFLSNINGLIDMVEEDDSRSNAIDIAYIVFFYITAALLQVQATAHVVHYFKPSIRKSKNWFVNQAFNQGTFLQTFRVKLASSLKTHLIVKNAFELHFKDGEIGPNDSRQPSKSSSVALLNYTKVTEKTERYGGLIHCWKYVLNQSFVQKEGLIINSRFVLANALQFFLVLLLLFYIPKITTDGLLPVLFPSLQHQNDRCSHMTFDPDKCSFLSVGGFSNGMGVCHDVELDYDNCIISDYTYRLNESDASTSSIYPPICQGLANLLEDGLDQAISLFDPGVQIISQELDELLIPFVNESLCHGLKILNETTWDLLANEYGIISESCNITQETLCDAQEVGNIISYEDLFSRYQPEYRSTLKQTFDCTSGSTINSVMADNILNQIRSTLVEGVLLGSSEDVWKLVFNGDLDGTADNAINQWLQNYLDPNFVSAYTNQTMFNTDKIASRVPAPTELLIPSSHLITEQALIQVDETFIQLEKVIREAITAQKSNLANLPEYLSIHIPIDDLCHNVWATESNVLFLVDAAGSTEEHFCRAQLTGCVANTGICLLGLGQLFIDETRVNIGTPTIPVPYQFYGDKCNDHDELSKIMRTKNQLGIIDTILPSNEYLIHLYIYTSIAIGLMVLLLVSSLFIPNVVLTTLKYRSGVIPSLRDKNFKRYRRNLTHLTFLVPSVFWSAFGMTFLIFGLSLIIIFAFFVGFVWERTQALMSAITAMVLATAITMAVKKAIVFCCGRYTYEGFYRKRPAIANITALAYECWHIFLSIGFVTARAFILVFLCFIFIGRQDRPFLAEDIALDSQPHIFRQAILTFEAHRHPYIERIGMMYLMKLKHGSNFVKKSSSTWRLLFVFALMPWLRKYRIIYGNIDNETNNLLLENINLKKRCNEMHEELKQSILKANSSSSEQKNIEGKLLLAGDFDKLDDGRED